MAPAWLLGQQCDFVDLDVPSFLAEDREHPTDYRDGLLCCPSMLWGGGV
jgi:hypothetical protein